MTQILRKGEAIIEELVEIGGQIRVRTMPFSAIYSKDNKHYVRENGSYIEVVEIMIDHEIQLPIYLIKKEIVIL